MKIENTQNASVLIDELKSIERYREFVKKPTGHFECHMHYNAAYYEKALIPQRYNDYLIPVVEAIITKIKKEIEAL